jgi:hypothetical protein
MRLCAALFLLGALAAPVQADPFLVDVPNRTIETSKIKIQFDATCPERILFLYYKPASSTIPLNSESVPWEFSGQTIQGLWSIQGWIFAQSTVTQTWTVISQDAARLLLRIESQANYLGGVQPPVRTDYTFFADSSCYQVERTILYSQVPATTSLQIYVLRISYTAAHGSWRRRNAAGTLTTGAFCAYGCQTTDWDEKWTQVVSSLATTTLMYAPESPHPMGVVDDYDANSHSDWTSPITPALTFTTDVTYRMLIHFNMASTNIQLIDDVYAWFSDLPFAGVVPPPPGGALRLSISPNPAAREARVAFDLATEAQVDLGVYDLAGRRVATLARGRMGAGAQMARWDGHGVDGASAGAGLYFVRLRLGTSEVTHKLIWIR